MLLDLCQIVQTFLYEKNKPPEYVSFHEGMEKRRARQMQQQKTEEEVRSLFVRLRMSIISKNARLCSVYETIRRNGKPKKLKPS